MRLRDMSQLGALGIATNIRTAIHTLDRNMMERIDHRYGGIRRITLLLVRTGFLTKQERRLAIDTMPCIDNPAVWRR